LKPTNQLRVDGTQTRIAAAQPAAEMHTIVHNQPVTIGPFLAEMARVFATPDPVRNPTAAGEAGEARRRVAGRPGRVSLGSIEHAVLRYLREIRTRHVHQSTFDRRIEAVKDHSAEDHPR
jgi:hypothetical protein